MPFTFSHPAIVLPFQKLFGRWVSLTGLVAGSLVPDFEYFIRMKTPSIWSHTLVGIFTFNLPVGILLCFIFHNVVRNPLYSNLPFVVHKRIAGFKRFNWNKYFLKHWLMIIFCILIAAFTHLIWDKFVHENGYLPRLFNFFGKTPEVQDIEITEYKTLHQISSVAGALVVLYAIFQLPVTDKVRRPFYFKYWILVLIMAALVLALRFYTGLRWVDTRQVIVTAMSAFLIGLISISFFLRREYY